MRPEYLEVLLFLAGSAVLDIKEKRISLLFTGAFAVIGIYMAADTGRDPVSVLAAAAPGAALMLVSVFSGGAIGFGDGIATAVAGFYLDAAEVLIMCCLGFLYAAVAAGIVFFLRRRGRDELPFLPFLFAGCAAGALLYGV